MPIIIACIALLFGSCSFINGTNIRALQLSALTSEEGKKIKSMSEEIIRCLAEKDKDGLKALFCEQIRNSGEFDAQIDEMFDFFVCDSYTESWIDTTASGGESVEAGKKTAWYVSPEITYIKVGVNPSDWYSCFYSADYYWQIVNANDVSAEGLWRLTVELLNTDKEVTVGNTPVRK